MPTSIQRFGHARLAVAMCAILLATDTTIAGVQDGAADDRPRLPITLRIHDSAGSQLDLQRARNSVEASFHGTGIAIEWAYCDGGLGAPRTCRAPLGPLDLVVRILPASEPVDGRFTVLGVSLVGPEGGRLSTVYGDRVLTLARRASVEPGPVLGRAIAHEVGHLLLGTSGHAATGLMREAWKQVELQRNRQDDWLFSEEEVTAMRAGVAMRLARTALPADPSTAARLSESLPP